MNVFDFLNCLILIFPCWVEILAEFSSSLIKLIELIFITGLALDEFALFAHLGRGETW